MTRPRRRRWWHRSRWWRRYVARIRAARRVRRRRRATAPDRLRAVLWNAKVGRRPKVVARKVRRIIRRHRPHAILLQEAHGYIAALRGIPDYRLIVADGHGEDRGNPMLIRVDLAPQQRDSIRCETPWIGPKAGRRHSGRVFTVADTTWGLLADVHRTRPGWSRGGNAFEEEYDRLLELARSTEGPLLIGGDQNIGTRPGPDRGPHTPWALAETIGAQVATASPGRVDYALVKGARVEQVEELGKYGSDHHAQLVTITRDRKNRNRRKP